MRSTVLMKVLRSARQLEARHREGGPDALFDSEEFSAFHQADAAEVVDSQWLAMPTDCKKC